VRHHDGDDHQRHHRHAVAAEEESRQDQRRLRPDDRAERDAGYCAIAMPIIVGAARGAVPALNWLQRTCGSG